MQVVVQVVIIKMLLTLVKADKVVGVTDLQEVQAQTANQEQLIVVAVQAAEMISIIMVQPVVQVLLLLNIN